jgi:fatty-acyl-CoA synthase
VINIGLGSWPARRARMQPGKVAFRQGDRSVTYRQLAERVRALASGLAARGVRPGDRVAYLGPNDISTFEALFAAGELGCILVPLNTRLAAPEISYLLSDCAPSVLLYAEEFSPMVDAVDPACPAVRLGGRQSPYEQVLAEGRTAAFEPAEVGLDHDAVILYTSGTTGRPKGAVLTHGSLTWNVMNQLAHLDVLSTDVVLCTSPLFHVTGLGQVSLPALFKGATVVIAPKFDPAWMLQTIAEAGISAFSAVPTMLQRLCDHPDWEQADLSSLRYVNFGGSPVLERVAVAWLTRGVPLLQGFGMTETSAGVFMALPDGAAARPVSAGVCHFFTDVSLLGPSGSCEQPPGTGEVVVRGPNLFRGYWNRGPETTGLLADGWFRTGDIVRVEEDGWSYVVGRVKDTIISGGENIYPAEIEMLIDQMPEVAESAVVGIPDPDWGEVALACVVLQSSASLTLEGLREYLEPQLARYKLPRYLEIVRALPRTATGKIRKDQLRAGAADGQPRTRDKENSI